MDLSFDTTPSYWTQFLCIPLLYGTLTAHRQFSPITKGIFHFLVCRLCVLGYPRQIKERNTATGVGSRIEMFFSKKRPHFQHFECHVFLFLKVIILLQQVDC